MASKRVTRDKESGSQFVIDVSHGQLHKGRMFVASDKTHSVTLNYVVDMRALTTTTEYHLISEITTDAACTVVMYRNPVWTTTSGTLLSNINRNELASYTSSLAIYTHPTVTTTGTIKLITTRIPAAGVSPKPLGGTTEQRPEWVLKPGNSYQFEITCDVSTTATVIFEWYEVDDDD